MGAPSYFPDESDRPAPGRGVGRRAHPGREQQGGRPDLREFVSEVDPGLSVRHPVRAFAVIIESDAVDADLDSGTIRGRDEEIDTVVRPGLRSEEAASFPCGHPHAGSS